MEEGSFSPVRIFVFFSSFVNGSQNCCIKYVMYAVFKTDFSKTFQKTNSSRSYSLDPGQEIEISISQYTHSVLGIWESTSIRPVYIWHDNTAFRSRHYSAALLLISAHIGRSGSFPRSCRSFFANNRVQPLFTDRNSYLNLSALTTILTPRADSNGNGV